MPDRVGREPRLLGSAAVVIRLGPVVPAYRAPHPSPEVFNVHPPQADEALAVCKSLRAHCTPWRREGPTRARTHKQPYVIRGTANHAGAMRFACVKPRASLREGR